MRLVIVVVSVVLAGAVVEAQTPAPPPRHEGSAEFEFVGTGGNSETQSIGLGGEIIYRPAPWETRMKVTYVRNESQDVLKAQAVTLVARGQRVINDNLSGYGQYAYLRDRFAGILQRNTVEAGLAFEAIDVAPHKLAVDAALGYANEQRLSSKNLSTATADVGAIYTLRLSSSSDLSEDGHVLFSLSDGSDWRFANAVAVSAKINSIFSLKLSNGIRYVRTPVAGFKSTDVVTSIALVARF